jgi:hypothetical protein
MTTPDSLSQAWKDAEEALPFGWELHGVMDRWTYAAVQHAITSDLPELSEPWAAFASSQSGGWIYAEGSRPDDSLINLADKLRSLTSSN